MVRLLKQAGQGQRQQFGKVFRQEDQSAFGKHVLDGIDHTIVDEVHSQDALVAGITEFVGEEQTQVERAAAGRCACSSYLRSSRFRA